MPFVRTDDRVRIYYEQHGENGSPLVLAYGLGCATDGWDVNVAALAARHRLVLWDPRGHGRSASPEDPSKYTYARWAHDLRHVLDELHIRRAHVGGLSLGGAIATHFTLRFPARVLSLLITNSGSAAGRPLSATDLVMRARSIKIAIEDGMDAVAEFSMTENANYRVRVALDPNAANEIREEYRKAERVGYANSVRALIGTEYIADMLSTIAAPVLLLTGDRDPSLKSMRWIHRKIPGSKLVVLRSVGHFANRERVEQWNRCVNAFLDRVDGQARLPAATKTRLPLASR